MFDIDPDRYRVLDLSLEVIPGASRDRFFDITEGRLADDALKYDVRTHTHVGTHVEAPLHFFKRGTSITDLPLSAYMGRGILAAFQLESDDPAITPQVLEHTIGDIIRRGDIVAARNDAEAGDPPYFTPDAARWLRDHEVKMIVVEDVRLSKDIPTGNEFHEILMSRGATFVEFASGLDQIARREFYVMALPIRVRGLDSAWCRLIAIEEK
jgi:arylformamidase